MGDAQPRPVCEDRNLFSSWPDRVSRLLQMFKTISISAGNPAQSLLRSIAKRSISDVFLQDAWNAGHFVNGFVSATFRVSLNDKVFNHPATLFGSFDLP